MKIIEFRIEKSELNPQLNCLIAVAENFEEYVVGGDCYNPTYLILKEKSGDFATPTQAERV